MHAAMWVLSRCFLGKIPNYYLTSHSKYTYTKIYADTFGSVLTGHLYLPLKVFR